MTHLRRFWVYILCCSDGSYYTGVTNNIEERLRQHQEGIDPDSYTFALRPVTLAYSQEFDSILDAISAEKQIKGWSRKKKEALISNNFDLLPLLAKKQFVR